MLAPGVAAGAQASCLLDPGFSLKERALKDLHLFHFSSAFCFYPEQCLLLNIFLETVFGRRSTSMI